jgi:integrase
MANGLTAFEQTEGSEVVGWTARSGKWWDQEPASEPLAKFPRVHDLRHTHASWLIADNIPLTIVQRRLGYESIKTTVDISGHLTEEHNRTAADSMSRALGSMDLEF